MCPADCIFLEKTKTYRLNDPAFVSTRPEAGPFSLEGWVPKPVSHTRLMTVDTLTDHPKSVRNHSVTEMLVAYS